MMINGEKTPMVLNESPSESRFLKP